MVDPAVEPGGDRPPGEPPHHPVNGSQVRPGQTFAGAAQAASGTVPGGRTWQQICSEAKEKRNILEIHIKMKNVEDSNQPKPKPLSNDQLSDFLFKILKIKVEDNIGLDCHYLGIPARV